MPDKGYSKELYDKQFSLYVDKLIDRIDMQVEAYKKEVNVPDIYFETQSYQKDSLRRTQSS